MIHRALFGSVERFFGDPPRALRRPFPLWLAPVQCEIVPVQDDAPEVIDVRRRAARHACAPRGCVPR